MPDTDQTKAPQTSTASTPKGAGCLVVGFALVYWSTVIALVMLAVFGFINHQFGCELELEGSEVPEVPGWYAFGILVLAGVMGLIGRLTERFKARWDWKGACIPGGALVLFITLAVVVGGPYFDRYINYGGEAEWAAATDRPEVLHQLRDTGYLPDPIRDEMLFQAIRWDSPAATRALLEMRPPPDLTAEAPTQNRGWTPLLLACSGARLEIVHMLLEAGAPVNQQGTLGRTCLHIALGIPPHPRKGEIVTSEAGRLAYVELLMKFGADPTLVSEHEETALGIAAQRRWASIEKALQKQR
ncbi:MAG: ankyrin repeat domain-containing protein [Bradymonadia bacterium]